MRTKYNIGDPVLINEEFYEKDHYFFDRIQAIEITSEGVVYKISFDRKVKEEDINTNLSFYKEWLKKECLEEVKRIKKQYKRAAKEFDEFLERIAAEELVDRRQHLNGEELKKKINDLLERNKNEKNS